MSKANVFTFTRPVGTSRKRVSLVANARDTLAGAGFGKLTEVDIATGGQFSVVDLVQAVIEKTGPADVTLCTWTAAEFDLTQIKDQLSRSQIREFRLIVDRSFVSRAPAFVKAVVESFGEESIRTTRTHAKFCVISNAEWSVVIRTSMNLNHNARMEYAQVTESPELAEFWIGVADSIFQEVPGGLANRRDVPGLEGFDQLMPLGRIEAGRMPKVGAL